MTRMPMSRPKLLFLSQTLPYPPDGGVKIRTYNILRLLARTFDITALCFYRRRHLPDGSDVGAGIEGVRRFGRVQAFPIPQERSHLRLGWDHLRSLLARRSYTVFTYESDSFQRALESLLADARFDLIHADSLDLSHYFPQLTGTPIACTHHDATSVQLSRRAAREAGPLRKWYVQHQSHLMREEERYWCERVALNVAVSPRDAETLRSIAPAGRYTVVPNGVDTEFFVEKHGETRGVVCVGGLSWFPNRDALEFFSDSILPNLRRGGDHPEIRWVGRASDADRKEYQANHGIEITGYVDDIRPHVWRAACYIVPIRVGGGTRVKILDAWAMGKAIVSTSVGCEGLDAVDGENILIRDDPKEFAASVHQVLHDQMLRERLGRAARETAEKVYSWEVIGAGLIDQYRSLLHSEIATTADLT